MKLCIDCRWHSQVHLQYAVHLCTHEQIRDPVTGGQGSQKCSSMREPDGRCGPEGVLHEIKQPAMAAAPGV
jgi:hypothetical protein